MELPYRCLKRKHIGSFHTLLLIGVNRVEFIDTIYDIIYRYLTNQDMWERVGQAILKVIAILLGSSIVIRIGKTMLQNVFKMKARGPIKMSERRQTTLLKLVENVLKYVVYFIALVMIIEAMGVDISALLAGAGIVGLAVGFGAQNLVRDIITGFFIIFEDQFSVGDFIRVGTSEGFVEEIGLRTTKIKSWTGELHILPNGNIQEVTNFSIHNSIAVVDVSIAYEGDIHLAEQTIQELLQELPDKYPDMIKAPELLGIQNLGASEVVMRVTCEVNPMQHFSIARALRKEIKTRLDEKGIEIPFPRLVMYTRKEESK